MREEKMSSLLFSKIQAMKVWPCGHLVCKHLSVFFRGVKSFLKTGIFWTLVPLNQKLPGFFLSCSFPLNLNCSFLPLPHPVSPFKPVDIHQIQQAPHLHATASRTEPSELKSQICSLTWGFLTRPQAMVVPLLDIFSLVKQLPTMW